MGIPCGARGSRHPSHTPTFVTVSVHPNNQLTVRARHSHPLSRLLCGARHACVSPRARATRASLGAAVLATPAPAPPAAATNADPQDTTAPAPPMPDTDADVESTPAPAKRKRGRPPGRRRAASSASGASSGASSGDEQRSSRSRSGSRSRSPFNYSHIDPELSRKRAAACAQGNNARYSRGADAHTGVRVMCFCLINPNNMNNPKGPPPLPRRR